jgi:cell division protein FtsL
MKIEIKIEKEGKDEKDMPEEMGEELTPEQIAEMAKKLKSNSVLSRAERTMLASYLLQEDD